MGWRIAEEAMKQQPRESGWASGKGDEKGQASGRVGDAGCTATRDASQMVIKTEEEVVWDMTSWPTAVMDALEVTARGLAGLLGGANLTEDSGSQQVATSWKDGSGGLVGVVPGRGVISLKGLLWGVW